MNCSKCGNVLLNFEGAVVPENVQRICRQCSGVNSDYQEGMTRATTASTAANLRCSICDLPIQRNHGMCPKCRESAAAGRRRDNAELKHGAGIGEGR
jgi:hypothetical protein